MQAAALLIDAQNRGMVGLCEGNEAVVRRALALDKSKQTQQYALLAAAVCGNAKLALPMAQDMGKKFSEDTLIQNVYIPLAKALVALAAGRPQEAIDDAEPAKPFDANYPASYVQGMAYLQLHDASQAQSAFQAAMQFPGSSLLNWGMPTYYAPAQLGLARAYAMSGDKANAKKAYDAFFVTWKNADADLPMLVAAKKEYATL